MYHLRCLLSTQGVSVTKSLLPYSFVVTFFQDMSLPERNTTEDTPKNTLFLGFGLIFICEFLI